ncbi:MAG: YIP1 family protein [Gemmatimonadota bacterium]|nr:YIP1 family protein [Gemmatimonadota bacterium]
MDDGPGYVPGDGPTEPAAVEAGGTLGEGQPAEGPAADVAPGRVPWEDPEEGFPANLFRTWMRSLAEPSALFRSVDPEAPLLRPLLYFLIVTVTASFFATMWLLAGVTMLPMTGAGAAAELAAPTAVSALADFFLSPFLALVGLGFTTLVVGLGVRLIMGAGRRLRGTAHLLCYTSGPMVLTIVPLVGQLVGSVWSIVLLVIGVREVHRTTTGQAVVAGLLVPLAAVIGVAMAAAILMALALAPFLGDLPLS